MRQFSVYEYDEIVVEIVDNANDVRVSYEFESMTEALEA